MCRKQRSHNVWKVFDATAKTVCGRKLTRFMKMICDRET